MKNRSLRYELRCKHTSPKPFFTTQIGNKTAYVGEELTFDINAKDTEGEPIYFGGLHIPISADYRNNGDGTATFRWTPAQPGVFLMIFTVTDGRRSFDEINHELIFVTVKEKV